MKGNQYWLRAFLLILVMLSLSLIGWGAHKGNNLDIYTILLTIGAAFFGVSSGMFLDQLIERKKADDALQAIKDNMHDIKRAILHDNLLTSSQDRIEIQYPCPKDMELH